MMENENLRLDGYVNMVNKVGTKKDPLENYQYAYENPTPDIDLAQIYATNGLFTNIINKPAELALKNGYNLRMGNADIEKQVEKQLARLKWKSNAAKALKWSRLFGGAVVLLGIDDGRDWDEPVDNSSVIGISNMMVFERPEVTPDYNSIYSRSLDFSSLERFSLPEYYMVSPIYGGQQIKVHESRLLLFRNGEIPRTGSMNTDYMFFGIPEYNRIKRELRDTMTTHGNGYRLLERCVQAVYKMKNLAALMATKNGEDDVIRRMQLIDMARSLLNTMVIDGEGEEWNFQTFQLGGVKDIIDESCNLLSAVTNIPQTVLFGRSPAGENATGEGDLTNYYDYVGQMQELNITDNLRRVIDLILLAEHNTGEIQEIPEYDPEPIPLWNKSEKEQAELDNSRAQAALTKAQAAQVYVDIQALDPMEVRRTLASEDEFEVDEILSEDDIGSDLDIDGLIQESIQNQKESELGSEQQDLASRETDITTDGKDINKGAAIIVVKNGKILCGKRSDNGLVCGPGGHIEEGETAEEAAVREATEEFSITPKYVMYLGKIGAVKGCLPSSIFLCTEFDGIPECDHEEMEKAGWMSLQELHQEDLFPAFEESIKMLINLIAGG